MDLEEGHEVPEHHRRWEYIPGVIFLIYEAVLRNLRRHVDGMEMGAGDRDEGTGSVDQRRVVKSAERRDWIHDRSQRSPDGEIT